MGLSQPNRGLASWPEVHRSCCKGMSVCIMPSLHLVKWTTHSMDCSQIVAAYNARPSGSQVELSRISVSLELEWFLEKWLWQGKKIWFFRYFFILHLFLNYLNVFSLIVTSIMTLCIPKVIIKLFFLFFLYNIYNNEWKEHKFWW